MSDDVLNQPLRGVAVYNPSRLLSKQELIGQFAVRTSLLESLVDDLRRVPPGESAQHYLLVGQRGMGKTTLLRRLRYAIEDDPALDSVWLPLDFPEEQYNVARLSDLYVNWLDALGDALQSRGQTADAERLDGAIDALPDDERQRAEEALQILKSEAERLKRRFLLLIDNIDLVLDRLQDEHWKIRTLLSAEPCVTVIGASAQAIEATYAYDQAFYDFFQIHDLRGLDATEMRRLLERLAELHQTPRVVRQLDDDPGRLPTLHVLTGGNPRTVILLYEILASGGEGSVRTDLDRLLDQHTPLYKARFESLSAQAQQVVDAMAIHWHPVTAGDLSQLVRLPVNAVSAQLDRLVNQGLVDKVAYYEPESKHGFQISERFFNIWYLMRASRRVRRKLIWLVEFLRLYHGPTGLRTRARQYLHDDPPSHQGQRIQHAEYGLALSEAIHEAPLRAALETSAVRALLGDSDLRGSLRELLDFEGEDVALRDRAEALQDMQRCRERIFAAKIAWPSWNAERFWRALGGSIAFSAKNKVGIAATLESISDTAHAQLLDILAEAAKKFTQILGSNAAVESLAQAFCEGFMTDNLDFGGATLAAEQLGLRELPSLALAMQLEEDQDDKLLDYLRESLPDARCPFPWWRWAQIAARTGKSLVEVEQACERALEFGADNAVTWYEVAGIYQEHLTRFVDAEAAFRQAISLDPKFAYPWNGLGNLYQDKLARHAEAEEAYRQAIALDPKSAFPWNGLGNLYQDKLARHAEAEEAYRQAIALDPQYASPWSGLGSLYQYKLARHAEAEEAYRQAVRLAPGDGGNWNSLAWCLYCQNGDLAEAEDAARKAVERAPASLHAAHTFATILARRGNWEAAVVQARRFLAEGTDAFHVEFWQDIITFFRDAVAGGHARDAVTLLDELGLSERWLPLREALAAAASGTPKYLRRVAPEVRQPAEEILARLTAETPDEPCQKPKETKGDSPKPRRSKKPVAEDVAEEKSKPVNCGQRSKPKRPRR